MPEESAGLVGEGVLSPALKFDSEPVPRGLVSVEEKVEEDIRCGDVGVEVTLVTVARSVVK